MKSALLIEDCSDSQKTVDYVAMAKAGRKRTRIKATQGETFVAHTYAARAEAAHAAGLAVDHYAYLTAENGTAQAAWFLQTVTPHLRGGDRVMADCEAPGLTSGITAAFIDHCDTEQPNVEGLIYGGPYFLRDNHIVSTHGWGLVLADYTTASKPVFWPPGFTGVQLEWQFTSSASLPWVSGPCDESRVVRAAKKKRPKKPFTYWQRRHTNAFIRSMRRRKNPPVQSVIDHLDRAIKEANRVKEIK
jgi:GH25 family lysozyme M1 (1,4-beta-N-acetylmuramidase)